MLLASDLRSYLREFRSLGDGYSHPQSDQRAIWHCLSGAFGTSSGFQALPRTYLPSGVLWRHCLHPEEKSLGPDGERCDGLTRGLLRRRPLKAMTPFNLIGKEVERRAQEGEDVSVLESTGPIRYQAGQRAKTRSGDPGLILRAKRFPLRQLMRELGVSQHSLERFLCGEPVHPSTRAGLEQAVEKLERDVNVPNRPVT